MPDITYEPVNERNYQRIISSLETELSRLKRDLLPQEKVSVAERDRQQAIWLDVDRVSRYLAALRERALDFVTRT